MMQGHQLAANLWDFGQAEARSSGPEGEFKKFFDSVPDHAKVLKDADIDPVAQIFCYNFGPVFYRRRIDGSALAELTLEIEASLPDGASDQIVRTVTENSRTLKFTSHGFESE